MKCRESTIRAPIFKAEQRTDTYFFNARLGYAIGSFESIAEVSLLSCKMVFGIARFVVGFLYRAVELLATTVQNGDGDA